MIGILMVCRQGGAASVLEETVERCRQGAGDLSRRWPDSYVLCLIPRVIPWSRSGLPDTTVPEEWRRDLSAEIIKLLQDAG